MSIDDGSDSVRRGAMAALGALLLGASAAAALATVLWLRIADVLQAHTGPWHVDAVVEAGVTAAGILVAVWLAASALVAAVCVLVRVAGATWRAGERLVQRCAPGVVRKALVVVVGASVGLGMASGASAAAPEPAPSVSSGVTVGADDLGWVVTTPAPDETLTPDTALPTHEPAAPARAESEPPERPVEQVSTVEPHAVAPAPTETVVVAAGDSLWAIAAQHLPPGATDAQIAEAWPHWYRANAATIGADPNVITPGQILAVPSTLAGASS